jgi:hypothetical protein
MLSELRTRTLAFLVLLLCANRYCLADDATTPEIFDPLTRQAFSALQKSASAGNVAAQYEVGARTAEGIGVRRQSKKGFQLLSEAASHGDIRAERRTGEMLLAGRGTGPDPAQASPRLLKAANAGDAQAQMDVALLDVMRTNAPGDYTNAFHWFSSLARRGNALAQRSLGNMYAEGRGVAKDLNAAEEWWAKAAAQSDTDALENLAVIRLQAGGETNIHTAMGLLADASVLGSDNAELTLGKLYTLEEGIPGDKKRGLQLLEDASRAGNAQAQLLLGQLFARGQTGSPDLYRAAIFFRCAAFQGLPEAQTQLGVLYETGHGVEKDPIEAMKWYALAAAHGSSDAAADEKTLSLFLNPAQRQEATRRAQKFKPAPPHTPVLDGQAPGVSWLSDEFRIPVSIFGETNYLVVDTGSSTVFLDETNRAHLGRPVATQTILTSLADRQFQVYNCPELRIGTRLFAPLWAACAPFKKLPMVIGEPCSGTLGMTCLKEYLAVFDADAHRFSLGGSLPDVFTNAVVIPLKTVPGHPGPVVEARVNGASPVYFELDTGDQGTINLSDRDWKALFSGHNIKTIETHILAAGDETMALKMTRIQNLAIGPNTYTDLLATSEAPTQTSSHLGQGFFRRHLCAIDFPRQRLYLVAGQHFSDHDETDMSGIALLRIEGKTVVRAVRKRSPANRAGIQKDDEILSLDHHDARSMRLKSINDTLRAGPGTKVELKINRHGELLDLAFTLKRFI